MKRLCSMIPTLVHFFLHNCFWHTERSGEASDTRTFSSAEAELTSRQPAVLDHNCARILSVRHLKPNSHLGRFVFPLSGCGGANHRQSNEDGNRKLSYRLHLCSSGPVVHRLWAQEEPRPPRCFISSSTSTYTLCVSVCVCIHLSVVVDNQVRPP